MSQPLSANPSPSDAAAALSSTRAAQPDLTNRREIPLSSFDFLAGAYAATKRARRITTAVMAVVVLGGFLNVLGAMRTTFEIRDVRSTISTIEANRADLIAQFGLEAGGVTTEDILARDRQVSGAIAVISARQGDFVTLLSSLSGAGTGDAQISRFAYGAAASAEGGSSSGSAGSAGSSPTGSNAPQNAPVRITVTAGSLAAVIALVEEIQQIPGLTEVRVAREGTSATVTAGIPLNKPPREVLDRLIELGISVQVTTSSSGDVTETDTPAPAAEEEGS